MLRPIEFNIIPKVGVGRSTKIPVNQTIVANTINVLINLRHFKAAYPKKKVYSSFFISFLIVVSH